MKLLIVEDEPHVRERIAEGIDWSAHQIELAAAVESAAEALLIMHNDRIDLVLSDIYMPEMSGLELARQIKAEFPLVKTILLSGYDDFEYARESIEHGVFKYLLKPADNEEIISTVLEARAVREKELLAKHDLQVMERRWREHLPHLRDLFYKNWLNGRYTDWEIEKSSQELLLPLEGQLYKPLILDMDPIAKDNERFRARDRRLVQFLLYTIVRDLLPVEDGVVLQDDDGMTAVVCFAPAGDKEEAFQLKVNAWVNTVLGTVKDCLKLTASAGIGPVVKERLLLSQAYKQSRLALQERLIFGSGIAIPYRDDGAVQHSWVHMEQLEKELELAIETGDEAKSNEVIRSVMDTEFAGGQAVADSKEMLWRFVCLLARMVHKHGWTLRDTLKDDFEDFEQFHQLLSKEQIGEWLFRMASRISRTITERRQSGTQIAMNEVVRFIHTHLHEETLSLYLIAENMYISYSYLSRSFKEATGESFSDYVLRLRMERAKELLAKGCKVYDVSEQVGYKHVNYFSKNFQKYWGMKPSEVNK
ncbi:two-component system, response regulator YesN [Paenibacillus sp. UNCCL117]|uniref:response regulator n=1 Tax=unclassified Paenibacillus TaxID=185978 RepID=UPI00089160C3|nr:MULTISPECIES: response regulator [unclassified Paenibacillus]SDC48643.1 two-component system, response regulator YesN [Paenibacillus sp. cl123]SFW11902.1 two-component system, response regulator YesN [Paenibacillus sp. UNCCL117]